MDGYKRILVAVPAFATIDEIASAIVFSHLLLVEGTEVSVYLGHNNYPLRLQKYLPAGETKFYQPKFDMNEVLVSLKLTDNKVKGVRWEQTADELKLHIEISKKLDQPEINISDKQKFEEAYLLSAQELSELEDYNTLTTHTNFANCKVVKLAKQANQISVAELVVDYAVANKLQISDVDKELLAKGFKINALVNPNLGHKLPSLLRSILEQYPSEYQLETKDYSEVVNYFLGLVKETQDLADFQALLAYTPQLNLANLNTEDFNVNIRDNKGNSISTISGVNTSQKLLDQRSYFNYTITRNIKSGASKSAEPVIGSEIKFTNANTLPAKPVIDEKPESQDKTNTQIQAGEYIPLQPAKES